VSESRTYRVRRALSHSELTATLDAVQTAGSTKKILAAVVQGVFGPLLKTVRESLADYGPHRTLDPGAFAIPATQWAAIADACHARADAFGTRTDIALALADLMPVSYDDLAVTVALRPTTDHRPPEHVLTVSREATDQIAAASKHCEQLGTYFGAGSPQYLNAVRTWQRGICTVFSMIFGAATRISRHGPMSLLINSSSGYVYALVFRPAPAPLLARMAGIASPTRWTPPSPVSGDCTLKTVSGTPRPANRVVEPCGHGKSWRRCRRSSECALRKWPNHMYSRSRIRLRVVGRLRARRRVMVLRAAQWITASG